MEWTQIAAWVVWAWVGLMTFFSVAAVISLFGVQVGDSENQAAVVTAACALNAILGLMLIQTLGLTV